MEYGALSLIPAAVTIVVALVWHRVATALFCGIAAGALTASGGSPAKAFELLSQALTASFTDPDRLKIVFFVLLVGGLLEVLSASGAYAVFARDIGWRLDTPFKARTAVWGLGMCLFFDDYANVLITGGSMRGITERHRISPAFLAYTVDVTAILASVMLVSTWSAYEGSVMLDAARTVKVEGTLSALFISSIPYHFYTFLAIFLALLAALTGRWIGARLDRDHVPQAWAHHLEAPRATAANVLAPILTLLGVAFCGLFAVGAWILHRRGEPLTLQGVFAAAPVVDVLITAALAGTAVGVAMTLRRRALAPKPLAKSFGRGVRGLLAVCMVILLAKGFSVVSEVLGAGPYIADSLLAHVVPALLPVTVFVLALLVTVATGFSWSSMAVVMPLAYQAAAADPARLAALVPVLSAAVITGAVAGEHVIPFSEKAVMSAAACRITPVYHVKTMLPQAVLAILAAAGAFVLLGVGAPPLPAYAAGAAFVLAGHFLLAVTPRPPAPAPPHPSPGEALRGPGDR